jgi:hypothetical protein
MCMTIVEVTEVPGKRSIEAFSTGAQDDVRWRPTRRTRDPAFAGYLDAIAARSAR